MFPITYILQSEERVTYRIVTYKYYRVILKVLLEVEVEKNLYKKHCQSHQYGLNVTEEVFPESIFARKICDNRPIT